MHHFFPRLLITIALGVACHSVNAEDTSVSRATILSGNCETCHGTNGVSTSDTIPSIAGFEQAALLQMLLAFKQGTMPSTLMGRIAKGYSDDELKQIASVFAKKP